MLIHFSLLIYLASICLSIASRLMSRPLYWPVCWYVSRPASLLACQPQNQIVPRSSDRPVCFLVSRALPLVAFQCVENTFGLHLRKRVRLRIDQCQSFKFIYCVDICVSLQYCINVTICFERFLGLQTRYVIAIILAGTSDSVSGNVSTSVSKMIRYLFSIILIRWMVI